MFYCFPTPGLAVKLCDCVQLSTVEANIERNLPGIWCQFGQKWGAFGQRRLCSTWISEAGYFFPFAKLVFGANQHVHAISAQKPDQAGSDDAQNVAGMIKS